MSKVATYWGVSEKRRILHVETVLSIVPPMVNLAYPELLTGNQSVALSASREVFRSSTLNNALLRGCGALRSCIRGRGFDLVALSYE